MTGRDSINPFKDDMTGKMLLGKYRIVRRLATGGMGVVYLARLEGAAGFVKPVVVKLILPLLATNEEFSGMFEREAKILANLQHPGIVGAIDFAEEQDCNVMVLEYVHGFQLGQWRRYLVSKDRMIPTSVVIQVMINVLDALHYAHTLKNLNSEPMKIVHRDISPSNIMLDTDGHIKLVDFGIAFAEEADDGYKTTNRSFKGKLPYSAPELFANHKASVRSDVYAAGVTLHELLFGRNEYNLKDHASIIQAVLNHVPTSIHSVRDDAPEQIDEVIWKAMAKKPAHRFQSAGEFAGALRDIITVPEHKALAQLAELVREDFGEAMSDFLGVESLTSRERAWRSPSAAPAKHTGDAPEDKQPEVVDNTLRIPSAETPPRETIPFRNPPTEPTATTLTKRKVPALALIVAVVVVAAAVGVAGFLIANRPKAEERRFLLVQKDAPEAPDDEPPPVDTGSRAVGKAPEDTPEPVSSDHAKAGVEKGGDAVSRNGHKADGANKKSRTAKRAPTGKPDPAVLTAAFKKRKGAVRQCFLQHPDDLEEGANVSVLFHVETSGKVRRADLSPSSMQRTPLGKCLVTVSKTTEFPPQSEAVTFRIPLSASRVKR
jgi:eukaryotic-like serine/threonine-protein kinase